MSFMAAFDTAYADRDAAAKAASGPVIGYVGNSVPVELIRAAGAFAQQVTGSPGDDTPDALIHMEPFFDGWVLSVFQRWLDGRLDHLTAVVIPRSSEVTLQLYYHMLEQDRIAPRKGRPVPVLFDILHTPFDATVRYNAGRLAALRDRLGAITGQAVTDDALSAEITRADAIRDALRRVNDLRCVTRPRLTGAEMLRISLGSTVMDPDAVLAATADLQAGAGDLPAHAGPRLVLTGSAHDTDAFHRTVEATGAVITANDHGQGDWWFAGPVGPVGAGDPMARLRDHYHLHAPTMRTYPRSVGDQRLLDAAARGRAQGCIFFTEDHDDALGFDYPTQRDLLAEKGIPTLFLKRQSYRAPDAAAQTDAVHAFLDTLRTEEPA